MRMGYVDKLLQKIFGSDTSNQNQPIRIGEALQRSLQHDVQLKTWIAERKYLKYTPALAQKYRRRMLNIESGSDFYIFKSHASLGFYFTCESYVEKQEYLFLLDFFKEQTLSLGYRLVNADIKTTEKGPNVERIERYYLKPPLAIEPDQAINQKFGNVLLELVFINEKPSYIKVMIHAYADRLYTEANDAEELVLKLLAAD